MTEPRAASCVVLLVDGAPPRLLWARRSDDAPFVPGFQVVPGGLIEPADAAAPTDGGDDLAARVAALRELFEEVGILAATGQSQRFAPAGLVLDHAEGPADGEPERDHGELRRTFQDAAAAGHARMAELGLRWRTAELVPIGRWVTPSFWPVRFDTRFFALRLDAVIEPDRDLLELDEAEWVDAPAALERWSRGEVLLGPPLASLLRGLAHRGGLDVEALCAVHGARGEETQRWEVVPWVQVLPLRTPTLPPATHTNAVLVGSGHAILVEPASPYPDEIERALAWIDEARQAGIEVVALVLTHHHPDHVGGARALGERLGVPLWAHRETAARLPELAFERLLEDGERIELPGPEPVSVRALHTPGHAPGHLCLIEERSRVMIAGDMVAAVGTILVEPGDGDMALYLRSLERMAAERPSMLVPAHGGPLRDPQAVLARYVAHRLERERRVLAALKAQPRPATALDLVPTAYDDAPRAVWPLAALSTEAHLLKLAAEGRARRTAEGWQACD